MIEAVLIMTVAWAVISTAAAMYQWERHRYWRAQSDNWLAIANLWRGLVRRESAEVTLPPPRSDSAS